MLLCDIHHRLYKGSGHATNGMFQRQSVHIEHYDDLCRVGTDGLSGRTRQTLWGGCADANPKLLPNDT